jgi:hypothetical protein
MQLEILNQFCARLAKKSSAHTIPRFPPLTARPDPFPTPAAPTNHPLRPPPLTGGSPGPRQPHLALPSISRLGPTCRSFPYLLVAPGSQRKKFVFRSAAEERRATTTETAKGKIQRRSHHGRRRHETVQEERQEEEEAARPDGGRPVPPLRNPNPSHLGDGVQQQLLRGVLHVGLHGQLLGDGLHLLLLRLGLHRVRGGRPPRPRLAARRLRQRHHRPGRLRLPRGRRGRLPGRRHPRRHARRPAAGSRICRQEALPEAQEGRLRRQWHGGRRDWQGLHEARPFSRQRRQSLEGQGRPERQQRVQGWCCWGGTCWPELQC